MLHREATPGGDRVASRAVLADRDHNQVDLLLTASPPFPRCLRAR
ncbi:MAG: hypothetical protein QOJ80_5008 [Mycobacterium sp.]|jgi:hypothetical protein|nr:hypothetical protein [Mycobacterium sp.]